MMRELEKTMPLTLDAEIAAALATAGALTPADIAVTSRGDVPALRAQSDPFLALWDKSEPDSPDVSREDYSIQVGDGDTILVRWYTKEGSTPGSAVVYMHGGGMIMGSMELYDRFVARYVQLTGVPFLSVDYRFSPEYPGTTSADDSYTALAWLVAKAQEFGVDPERVAVMGDSGGGGVAAAVAIAARDAGTPLARQILIYPMLDDRNVVPDEYIAPFAGWTYDNNFTGWNAVLGDDLGTDRVSPLAAPARLADFAGLAPAFIDVGELDIFRDESVLYALALTRAGVSCELHVRAGAIHAFDRLAPSATVSEASWSDRYRVISAL